MGVTMFLMLPCRRHSERLFLEIKSLTTTTEKWILFYFLWEEKEIKNYKKTLAIHSRKVEKMEEKKCLLLSLCSLSLSWWLWQRTTWATVIYFRINPWKSPSSEKTAGRRNFQRYNSTSLRTKFSLYSPRIWHPRKEHFLSYSGLFCAPAFHPVRLVCSFYFLTYY